MGVMRNLKHLAFLFLKKIRCNFLISQKDGFFFRLLSPFHIFQNPQVPFSTWDPRAKKRLSSDLSCLFPHQTCLVSFLMWQASELPVRVLTRLFDVLWEGDLCKFPQYTMGVFRPFVFIPWASSWSQLNVSLSPSVSTSLDESWYMPCGLCPLVA